MNHCATPSDSDSEYDDNDDVIENDDFFDEPSIEKEMILFENEGYRAEVDKHLALRDNEIDYFQSKHLKDKNDIELPNDSLFIPMKKELSLEKESAYFTRIDNLFNENSQLKQLNSQLLLNKAKIKETSQTSENDYTKSRQILEETLNEKERLLNRKKSEEAQLQNSNKELQLKIDTYLKEFNEKRSEIEEKGNAVIANQEKLLQLSKAQVEGAGYFFNRSDMVKRIKERTASIMLQLTNTNAQISQLIIENNLLHHRFKSNEPISSNTPLPQEIINPITSTPSNSTALDKEDTNPKKTPMADSNEGTGVKVKAKAKLLTPATTPTTTMTIFPCQQEMVKKEKAILEVESALYKLQMERDALSDNLSKLPEFPKQKGIINHKLSLESSITEFNNKINHQKQKLRELTKAY